MGMEVQGKSGRLRRRMRDDINEKGLSEEEMCTTRLYGGIYHHLLARHKMGLR